MATKKVGARRVSITASAVAESPEGILELGPAGTQQQVSTMALQFNPDLAWSGEVVVVGRSLGVAAQDAQAPFLPIPYRRVNVGGLASDYALVSDPITGTAMIQVPANGLTIGLLCAVGTGVMTVLAWDLQGPSSV